MIGSRNESAAPERRSNIGARPSIEDGHECQHPPVLTDFTSDGFLRLAFPMTEVRTGSDQIRQESGVEARLVSLDVIVYAVRPVASSVCMSLVRDGNVFAVWVTAGFWVRRAGHGSRRNQRMTSETRAAPSVILKTSRFVMSVLTAARGNVSQRPCTVSPRMVTVSSCW